jgi:hypothetical protein
MAENAPQETKYIFTDADAQGNQLDGKSLYSVTFPKGQVPPVDGFWSLTLYNQYHFFNPNSLQRFSLGTKNKTLQYNADGSLTLYAGANVSGQRQRDELAACAGDTVFAVYTRLLGETRDC